MDAVADKENGGAGLPVRALVQVGYPNRRSTHAKKGPEVHLRSLRAAS